jgi:fluoroquinolone resistance protein
MEAFELKFTSEDFTASDKIHKQYESCEFINCNFSSVNLSGVVFIDCRFVECDLSLAKLDNAAFRDCHFKKCKMLGLHFDKCNSFLFRISTENCTLNLSSFYGMNLTKQIFKGSTLHEVDFTSCNLSAAVFPDCDLTGAVFESSVLEKADFTSAYNYIIDPERNNIKKAKFSINGLPGLLMKYNIGIEQ